MISHIGQADLQTWWSVAKADPQATFYQTPAWFEVAQCMEPRYTDATLTGTLASGTRFVFPLISYSRTWPLKRLQSVFDYCYGGVIADGPISDQEFKAILESLPLNVFTRFNLTEPAGVPAKHPLPSFTSESFTSSILDLTGLTFEQALANFSRSHRTGYRKCISNGLTVRMADIDQIENELDIFYEVYQDTLENRWGDDVLSLLLDREFLTKLGQVMQKYPENMYLWFAELEGEAVAAEINFVWNGRLDVWSIVAKHEYFKLKPTLAMLSGIIKHAIDIDVTTFDFGPNLGKKGLEDFKGRFGAETVHYNTWEKPSLFIDLIERLRS